MRVIIKNGLRIDLEQEYYDMIGSMIIKYNQAWMRMVRYSQAIVVGMKYYDVMGIMKYNPAWRRWR